MQSEYLFLTYTAVCLNITYLFQLTLLPYKIRVSCNSNCCRCFEIPVFQEEERLEQVSKRIQDLEVVSNNSRLLDEMIDQYQANTPQCDKDTMNVRFVVMWLLNHSSPSSRFSKMGNPIFKKFHGDG